MDNALKSWCIGVATALSVGACGAAGTLFVDVQLLKSEQRYHTTLITQQQQSNTQIKELLTSLDKQMAVQDRTVKTLSDMVKELKKVRGSNNVN